MEIYDNRNRLSDIINYVLMIITIIVAIYFYRINYLLVTLHLPPMSPVAIFIMIYTIIFVKLNKCTKEIPINYFTIFTITISYLFLCYCLIGNLIKGISHPYGTLFEIYIIYLFSKVLFIILIIFLPYPLFKLISAVDETTPINKLNTYIITEIFLLIVSITAFMNIDLNGGLYFYPRYVKTITLDAINNNNTNSCIKLTRTYFSKNYVQVTHTEGYHGSYSYPVVVSSTCLASTKAIKSHSYSHCFINHESDYYKIGKHKLKKLERLLIAQNCRKLYLDRYSSEKNSFDEIIIHNVDYPLDVNTYPANVTCNECDNLLESFDGIIEKQIARNNNIYVTNKFGRRLIAGKYITSICASKSEDNCSEFHIYLIGKRRVGILRWKSILDTELSRPITNTDTFIIDTSNIAPDNIMTDNGFDKLTPIDLLQIECESNDRIIKSEISNNIHKVKHSGNDKDELDKYFINIIGKRK